MVFSIVIILLVGIIAYFHVVQGLFSSIISVICALVASLMAISYHEKVSSMLFASKVTDQGDSVSLVLLFMAIYLVLRVIFDSAIPGNVRLPAMADKVGGAILGAIAGALAMAIFAIAAQGLPYGPAIFGYSRYAIESSRDVKIPPSGSRSSAQMEDTLVLDELKSDTIKDEDATHMLVPFDDMFIGLVQKLSDGGSLDTARKFTAVHPAYLDELFFQRLGVQGGAKHVLANTAKQQQFTVHTLRFADTLGVTSAEIGEIRFFKDNKPVKSDSLHALLIVRVVFAETATDSDHFVRMAPAAARIVANGKNFIPLGTLENGGLYVNKPDDFMFIQAGMPVDFVFSVDRQDVIEGGAAPKAKNAAASPMSVKSDVFLEIKRSSRVSISGLEILHGVVAEPSTGVLRKKGLKEPELVGASAAPETPSTPEPPKTPGGEAGEKPETPENPDKGEQTAPPSSGGGPVAFVDAQASGKLLSAINIGKHAAEGDATFNSGTASVKDGKLTKFEIHPTDPLDVIGKGDDAVSEVSAPSDTHIVIVNVDAGASGWQFAEELSGFELVDSSGITYKPNGALAKVTKAGKEYLVGAYNADEPVEKIAKQDGTPTRVSLIFVIPDNTPLAALNFKDQKIADVNLK